MGAGWGERVVQGDTLDVGVEGKRVQMIPRFELMVEPLTKFSSSRKGTNFFPQVGS